MKNLLSVSARGFTLIELLVVIAIIGILASVVLASLNSGRDKSADAAVKSNLVNLRTQAQLQFELVGCYADTGVTCAPLVPAAFAGSCSSATVNTLFVHTKFTSALAAILKANGGALTSCRSNGGGTQWVMAAMLKSDNTKAWCVDSTGVSKEVVDATGYDTQAKLNADTAGAVCGS